MTFPPDSHFNRPEHTLPPAAHRTPSPTIEIERVRPARNSDVRDVPINRLEDWYRTLNEHVVSDSDPGNDVLEDLRDEIYSYLRG